MNDKRQKSDRRNKCTWVKLKIQEKWTRKLFFLDCEEVQWVPEKGIHINPILYYKFQPPDLILRGIYEQKTEKTRKTNQKTTFLILWSKVTE